MNMNKAPSILTLTSSELACLIDQSGLSVGANSPLAGFDFPERVDSLPNEALFILRGHGWIEDTPMFQMTEKGKADMQALCEPRASVSLVAGSRNNVLVTRAYSSDGLKEAALVSYLYDEVDEKHIILPGQSHAVLADTLIAQLVALPPTQGVEFEAAFSPQAFVTLLGVLDLWIDTRVRTMLDRDVLREAPIRARAVWEMLVEGRMTERYDWMVSLFTLLIPYLDFNIEEEVISEALQSLVENRILDPVEGEDGLYRLSENLEELAEALLPISAYGAMRITIPAGQEERSSLHLAFVQGMQATLMIQPTADAEGNPALTVDSVSTEELAEVLFTLGLPDKKAEEAIIQAEPVKAKQVCPNCGTEVAAGRKFCTQCGMALVRPGPESEE